MTYATSDKFVSSVTVLEAKALAPVLGDPAGYDVALIEAKLADVSAIIDTYLAGRYGVPLTPVPRSIELAAIALAREALDRQGRDHVVAEANRIRAWLKDLSKGVATLGVDPVSEDAPAATPSAGPVYAGPDRVFDDGGPLADFLGGR